MFEEAHGLDNAYFRTKHNSEGVVRSECRIPWRVYRPGIVVGHSETGVIDKIDGPYYFFKLIQKMRKMMSSWMPTLGIEGGRINIVPVDYVVSAIIHIAHKAKLDGKCFHLTDPKPKRIGEVLNLFADAAHAPKMTMRIDARLFNYIPTAIKQGLRMLPPVRRISHQFMKDLGLPPDLMKFVNYPTKFDSRETERALKGSGIILPRLDDYAWRLWDYWERNLDPELFIDRSLRGHVSGKVVVITGISFTSINMPLVRTPMIAPTKMYDNVPTITPDEAAQFVKQAVIYKPQRIATRLGIFAQMLHAVAPKIAFASLMRGIHW